MKRSKQRLSLSDLGRIPLTPLPQSGYESSKDLWDRLKREEAEAALAPQRAKEQANAQVVAEIRKLGTPINTEVAACWSRPIGSFTKEDAVADSVVLGGYTTREVSLTDNLKDWSDEHNESYTEFCRELDRRGIVFNSADAVKRLAGFMVTNVHKAGIAYSADNWMRCFERLFDLGVITANEVTGYTPATLPATLPTTAAQTETEVPDPIEHGSHADAVEIIGMEMRRDWQAMYKQFADFMQETYGVNVLQQRIIDFAVKWSEKWNKSLANPTHLNELRRALDYQQLLGPRGHLLTADERTARALEDTPLIQATFETKQDIVTRLKGLAQVD